MLENWQHSESPFSFNMDDQPLINNPPTICDEDPINDRMDCDNPIKDRLDCDDPDLEVEEVEKRGKSVADAFLKSEIDEGLKKAKLFSETLSHLTLVWVCVYVGGAIGGDDHSL